MPDYLWTGKDKFGNSFTERVNADTTTQAKKLLDERGCTELKLHTDDFAEAGRAQFDQQSKLSAADQLKFQSKDTTLWGAWAQAFKASAGTNILFLLLLVFFLLSRRYVAVTICAIGFLAYIPIYFWFRQSSRYFSQLNKAKVWHRWNEVLNCIEKLKRTKRWTKIGVPEPALINYQALALSGLGRFDEAVAKFSTLENNPKVPRWLYLCQLAAIHGTAKKYDEAVDLNRQAAEFKPNDPVILIDLATRIVRRQKDAAQAKVILNQAEQGVVVELAKPHIALCRGIIAYQERDYIIARTKLLEALTGLQQFMRHSIVEGTFLTIKAYLCCVEGALGNLAEARRLFGETRKYLQATKENELLAECKTAAQES